MLRREPLLRVAVTVAWWLRASQMALWQCACVLLFSVLSLYPSYAGGTTTLIHLQHRTAVVVERALQLRVGGRKPCRRGELVGQCESDHGAGC